MIKNLPTDLYWYLVTIDDYPRMLIGESFFEMLKLIKHVDKINFVVLNDIQGSGKYGLIASLQDNVDNIYGIENILEITNDIDHLEWGDFFLFKEYPNDLTKHEGAGYPYLISKTDTTLRAVDDQYMYIYTQSKKIIEVVKSQYEIESIKFDLLENLDFPY